MTPFANGDNTPGADEEDPNYGPDGEQIVYTRLAPNADLWLMKVDGSGQHPLTSTPTVLEEDASFSPDGNRAARASGRRSSAT